MGLLKNLVEESADSEINTNKCRLNRSSEITRILKKKKKLITLNFQQPMNVENIVSLHCEQSKKVNPFQCSYCKLKADCLSNSCMPSEIYCGTQASNNNYHYCYNNNTDASKKQ